LSPQFALPIKPPFPVVKELETAIWLWGVCSFQATELRVPAKGSESECGFSRWTEYTDISNLAVLRFGSHGLLGRVRVALASHSAKGKQDHTDPYSEHYANFSDRQSSTMNQRARSLAPAPSCGLPHRTLEPRERFRGFDMFQFGLQDFTTPKSLVLLFLLQSSMRESP
jgi:hypothetical protein